MLGGWALAPHRLGTSATAATSLPQVTAVASATPHYHLLWGAGQQVAVGQVEMLPCCGQNHTPIPDGLLHVPQGPLSLLKFVAGLLGGCGGSEEEVRGTPILAQGKVDTPALGDTGRRKALWALPAQGRP